MTERKESAAVVIGSGVAGLAAARHLVQAGAHVMSVSCCLGGQGRAPKLDSMGKSSSKHKVTEEVNFQCVRRISHVATTRLVI
jgi:flavin-dependent dehydrogenase